jgi:HEAT repeat protein
VPRRQRAAVRLAGETQNPRLVPSLRDALLGASDEIAREAAHALARVGDVSSLEALTEALESPRPAIVGFAAAALGTTGRALAVGPLAAVLDRALGTRRQGVARDAVRALGRSARAEAVPILAQLLGRGGILQRGKLRDLKLAAVAALTQIPDRSAEAALTRAAKGTDGAVRQAATVALKRRSRRE